MRALMHRLVVAVGLVALGSALGAVAPMEGAGTVRAQPTVATPVLPSIQPTLLPGSTYPPASPTPARTPTVSPPISTGAPVPPPTAVPVGQPKPAAPAVAVGQPKPAAPAVGAPGAAQSTPRAGGFPIELAPPLVAGGVAAFGVGVYVLTRGRRP